MSDEIYIDPQMRPALARMQERMAALSPTEAVTPQAMRESARETFAAMNVDAPELKLVRDTTLPGAFGPRPVRIYDALGERQQAPGLIYYHGGGWVVGDLDTEDAKLRRLALQSGVRIVSIDYVLAPEHRFPQPLEDAIALARAVHEGADALGLDPQKLAIGGASAGANLALSTALALRDAGRSWLRLLVLFYGVFDMASRAPSRTQFAEGFGLGADAMELFYLLYLNDPAERTDPAASPLRANLHGLPPAWINAASLDVLRDDSHALAEKMRAAGIAVAFEEYPGVIHGYTSVFAYLPNEGRIITVQVATWQENKSEILSQP